MFKFPSLKTPAIIAFKGLPATRKSFIAALIAKWAKSPVLCIEDFLAPDASPSMDEAQHLLRRTFDALCRVAERQAKDSQVNCVVIKSRLCTTFELDRLINLMLRCDSHTLLIVQCRCVSEYQGRYFFVRDYVKEKHWYKLKSWNEVEMAGEEYDAQAWDLHFENSIMTLPDHKRRSVRRLVVDVFSDALLSGNPRLRRIEDQFSRSIVHLVSNDATICLSNTITFHDLRRALVERSLNTPRQKGNYICRRISSCIFKYREEFEANAYRCRVCEKPIAGAGYECYKCNLVLHKSCAEEPTTFDKVLIGSHSDNPYYRFTRKHACEHCNESGKPFSLECRLCLLNTHLKCRLMPTIVKHDCHPEHFLQVWLASRSEIFSKHFTCVGCGNLGFSDKYMCYVCGCNYHIGCVATPREVKHRHGGYEHVIQLMYSFDGMGEKEDFWCDVCHKDMDTAEWFYRCKECPYYVSHMDYHSRLPCKDIGC